MSVSSVEDSVTTCYIYVWQNDCESVSVCHVMMTRCLKKFGKVNTHVEKWQS